MATEWMGLTEEKYARRVNKVRAIDNQNLLPNKVLGD